MLFELYVGRYQTRRGAATRSMRRGCGTLALIEIWPPERGLVATTLDGIRSTSRLGPVLGHHE